MPSAIMWLGVPFLGGVIGYVTNRIAVRMIFRPIRPVYILGIRVQGLIGRRQAELADNIGRVVGDHLVHHKDLVDAFGKIDFQELLGSVLDNAIGPKIEELRAMPFVGALLTDDRVASLRQSITSSIVQHQDSILEALEQAIEDGLDVQSIVRDRVAAFPVEKLESLVLGVASRELRAIEVLGAVLGTMIGVGQVFLIWALD